MRLRKLELKDAPLMLEWMHDDSVVHYLSSNFKDKTLEDCRNFIRQSHTEEHQAFAIVDNSDTYLGTVSLKHIDKENKTAEFAIAIRREAMGKGVSKYGMNEILSYAHEELRISSVYWCVSKMNIRAIKFYDKMGFSETKDVPESLLRFYPWGSSELKWYLSRTF